MNTRLKLICCLMFFAGSTEFACSQAVVSGLVGDSYDTIEIEFDGEKISLRENQLVEMDLSPNYPPVPALKHRLFPSLRSLKKGDAATLYHRAILFHRQAEAGINYRENRMKKDRGEKVPFQDQSFDELSELLDRKLTKPELDELKSLVENRGGSIFREMKLAEKLRDCDWGFEVNQGRPLFEYISFLLPEIQEVRSLTRFLALRAKVQIASNDYEGAIETIRVGLKMAKSTEDTQFMVCSLVGVACSSIMLEQVESLIGAKDSPNLYWALESLPKPLMSVKPSVMHEVEFLRDGAGLKVFRDPENLQMSSKQWNQLLVEDLGQLAQVVGGTLSSRNPSNEFNKLKSLTIMLRGYPIAKRQLVEWGYDQKKVDAMPAVQVLAIHESRMLTIIADEILKSLNLNLKEAKKQIDQVVDDSPFQVRIQGEQEATYEELIPLATTLLPAVNAVLRAESRVARRIKYLQTVEALRMHAAIHKSLPGNLDEVKCLPMPKDPVTGKYFVYRKTANGCMLWELNPLESLRSPLFTSSRVLKITLRK